MDQLDSRDKSILDFEARQYAHAGAKETAIVQEFGVLPPSYYARLNWLLGQPEALAYAPQLVHRLERLREARARQRSAGRLAGF